MKCDRFCRIAGQLARNEIMDAHERDKALAHAGVCQRCEEVLASQSRLSAGLRLLAEATKDAPRSAGMEDKVLAAFRELTCVASVSAASGRRRYWTAAAAAMVLLAVGGAAWRWHVASVPRQTQQAKAQEPAPPAGGSNRDRLPAAPIGQTPGPRPSNALGPRRSQPRRHSTTRAAQPGIARRSPESLVPAITPETREVVTHFVSVGYGSALDLQDGGQLVRVDLPRSALSRFGLPMNMDRADERITADVLIGTDGLARAIRFVEVKAIDKK